MAAEGWLPDAIGDGKVARILETISRLFARAPARSAGSPDSAQKQSSHNIVAGITSYPPGSGADDTEKLEIRSQGAKKGSTNGVASLTRPRDGLVSGDDGLIKLLSNILSYVHQPMHVMRLLCEHFGATASVLWIRDSHTVDEFEVYAKHNRPDLLDPPQHAYFSLSNNDIIAVETFNKKDFVYGTLGVAPFSGSWLEKPYTESLEKLGVRHILLIPIVDEHDSPFGIISIYFQKPAEMNVFSPNFSMLSRFVYSVFKHIVFDLDAVNGERRKMGHEINAAAAAAAGSVDKLQRLVNAGSPTDAAFDDLRVSLNVIQESSRQYKFSDSVKDKRRSAREHDFREAFNSAAQPLISQQRLSRVSMSALQMADGEFFVLMTQIHLRQLIDNVVSNAIKYSAFGGLIRSRAAKHPAGGAIFRVSNLSSGIPKDEWTKLWNQRYRGRNARGSKIEGEGMGLAIVREICEVYNISYEYRESRRDSGARTTWSNVELIFPKSIVVWEQN